MRDQAYSIGGLTRLFCCCDLGVPVRKIKAQHPNARLGMTIVQRWVELPLFRGSLRGSCKIIARTLRYKRGILNRAAPTDGDTNVDFDRPMHADARARGHAGHHSIGNCPRRIQGA